MAYAVAKRLGYGRDAVIWQNVPFNSSFAPGAKKFDFDINQVSISEAREKAVAFSSGYYDVRQAVVALKCSKAARAKSVADLKGVKLGAQVGTSSLDFITDVVKPTQEPAVYPKNDLAKLALKNGQVDAIVVDLPTAFYITGAEVPEAKVVGQFANQAARPSSSARPRQGQQAHLLRHGAVDALRKDGTLAALEKEWLSEAVDAPVLK